jgi:uncharacterized protein (DUF1501 family)
MAGAPSQLDLFDYKPKLVEYEGKPIPPEVIGGQRYAFIRSDAAVLGPCYKFAKHGGCGAELSEMLPHLAKIVDDITILKSVRTDQFNHAPAQLFLNTGFSQPGRPSFGSWVLYGLGAETSELPAFVVMSTGSGISGGAANWSSGFLPTLYAGVRLRNQGDPILNVSSPAGIDAAAQRATLDLVGALNRERLQAIGDPEIATRIASYEMAYRLQSSAPELMDLSQEDEATLKLYGIEEPGKASFARACLLARRMVERGVRFIQVYHNNWDTHANVAGRLPDQCRDVDQACYGLVQDLKQRGLLDQTLIIWGGEFGRTIYSQGGLSKENYGRDHHPRCFTLWMAGGGIKPGTIYGETDDFSYNIVKDPCHLRDWHATLLHLLGFDHERFSVRHQGLDQRLTGVEEAKVIKELLA